MAALEPSAFDEWSARPTLPKRSQVLRRHRSDIRVAVLGLPNSGKTGLFNLLTGLSAPVDDAAFSTREAQTGVARVDDPRFAWLCEHFEPNDAVPCRVRVVDTPALVAGSADNRGIGSVCDGDSGASQRTSYSDIHIGKEEESKAYSYSLRLVDLARI